MHRISLVNIVSTSITAVVIGATGAGMGGAGDYRPQVAFARAFRPAVAKGRSISRDATLSTQRSTCRQNDDTPTSDPWDKVIELVSRNSSASNLLRSCLNYSTCTCQWKHF